MKKMLIALLLILLAVLCACGQIQDMPTTEAPPTTESQDVPTTAPVFDFTELNPEDFPRGEWSINQLIKKYGPLTEDVTCLYFEGYGVVRVDGTCFKGLDIMFAYAFPEMFSFGKQKLEQHVRYPLDETDWDNVLGIKWTTVKNKAARLPRGLKIGKSTKEDVLAAYPAGAETAFFNDGGDGHIYFNYEFPERNDGGSVEYSIDENGILVEVAANWFYGDDLVY